MLVTVDRYCDLTGRTEYAVRSYIYKVDTVLLVSTHRRPTNPAT